MSKASDWAFQLETVDNARRLILRERPPEWCFHGAGTATLIGSVNDEGLPVIAMRPVDGTAGMGGRVSASDIPDLVKFAQWIIDTFGEERR